MKYLEWLKKKYERSLLKYPFESKEEGKNENIEGCIVCEKNVYTALEAPYRMRNIKEKVDKLVKDNEYYDYIESSSSSFLSWIDEPFYDDLRLRINLTYKGKQIVDDSEIKLIRNERYGLVGRNGAGKTTLLRAIMKRKFGIPRSVKICGIKQDFVSDERVIDIIGECGFRMLRRMGFKKEMGEKSVRNLSGGWRMRVQIASAIESDPDVLLLDEPTNFLDLKGILFLEEELRKMRTVVVVSHDRNFLNSITNYTMCLENQEIRVFRGNYDEYERQKEMERKRLTQEYENYERNRMHLQSFIDRFRYSASRADQAQSKIKILNNMVRPIVPPVERRMQFSFGYTEINGVIFEMENFSYSFDDELTEFTASKTLNNNEHDSKDNILNDKCNIISNISISIKDKSRIVIVGDNGEGKSTILKAISGVLPKSKLKNKSDEHKEKIYKHSNLRIGYFAQHHVDHLDHNQNALSVITALGFREEEAISAMARFGLNSPNQKIGTLSGGQKSRLAFTLISLNNPNLLILDEPTNHLDMQMIKALADAIKNFPGAVVCVSHDLSFIQELFNDVYVCAGGKLTKFYGSPQDYKNTLINEIKGYSP